MESHVSDRTRDLKRACLSALTSCLVATLWSRPDYGARDTRSSNSQWQSPGTVGESISDSNAHSAGQCRCCSDFIIGHRRTRET